MSGIDSPQRARQALDAFDLLDWVEANRPLMIPPLTNQTIFKGNDNFIVMVAAGPNPRKDFHYNESEELFLQLQGGLEMGLVVDGRHEARQVNEGEMFLLPPRLPHQPRRAPGTYGLVIEKHRVSTDRDAFIWYCEQCQAELWRVMFLLEDIVQQQPLLQREFYRSQERRTCDACGHVMQPPEGFEENIARIEQDNPYVETNGQAFRGRSW